MDTTPQALEGKGAASRYAASYREAPKVCCTWYRAIDNASQFMTPGGGSLLGSNDTQYAIYETLYKYSAIDCALYSNE